MGSTFVHLAAGDWKFDATAMFAKLRRDYSHLSPRRGINPLELVADDPHRGWELFVDESQTTIGIHAPAAPTMELVAWVRAFVPAEVPLEIFEDQLSFDVAPLPVGITADQVRERFFPDAWEIELMSRPEGPRGTSDRGTGGDPPLE